jgi:hypothetical protein
LLIVALLILGIILLLGLHLLPTVPDLRNHLIGLCERPLSGAVRAAVARDLRRFTRYMTALQ